MGDGVVAVAEQKAVAPFPLRVFGADMLALHLTHAQGVAANSLCASLQRLKIAHVLSPLSYAHAVTRCSRTTPPAVPSASQRPTTWWVGGESPPLPSLLAFEAIARRKSFALAAAELHLTPSTVSHQVARLEGFLGVKLFERSSRGVKLSPAGESYLQRVAGALGAIGAATDDVRQGVRNSLYVHASPSFASLWLMPRIGQFAQAHPGVSLFLSASHVHSDFELGQVDLDIRYGVPHWPPLVVKPIFREPADLLQVSLIQSTVTAGVRSAVGSGGASPLCGLSAKPWLPD
jgi:Bacterial regulatory helix-turn-helix protein, lysR family/LysR substrate binding domain